MPFPSPPWRMQGQMWLTLFRCPKGGPGRRPAGTYGVGLVDYQPGSVLTYGELLVARPVAVRSGPGAGKHVTVTDIWVDSVPSREGGRSIWAVPKEMASFDLAYDGHRKGAGVRASVTLPAGSPGTSAPGRPVASVTFSAARLLPPRLPFSGTTWQPRDDAPATVASLHGSSRPIPVRGTWDFAQDGPLAWLREARPLVSIAMHDFRMTFGGARLLEL